MSKEQILAEFDAKRDELREYLRSTAYRCYNFRPVFDETVRCMCRVEGSVLFGYSSLALYAYTQGEYEPDAKESLLCLEPPDFDYGNVCYVGRFRCEAKEIQQLSADLNAERARIVRSEHDPKMLLSEELADRLLDVVRRLLAGLHEVLLTVP